MYFTMFTNVIYLFIFTEFDGAFTFHHLNTFILSDKLHPLQKIFKFKFSFF